ncbi:tRNA pseudouridine(55) synthase TruB [Crassaminicella thermophila]|uniref:tRNA pseudouridine synthase B n=1 Tax=Crassaminicella thermophila TaxID=2599308 RepID=A0A5C0SI11_CRATE|nr:tRNA pseudouridine(55) synthase TruB [Crassaminicella thermophila]QEK13622.1 tRNA pseudouridine(55) synthase TruB [Crassaminicella thermophila]
MKGIINVLKPPHMTSHDVVNFIRKKLNIKKVGHTGTLDPMAAGVLPICVGAATKISQYLLNDKKKYRCEMVLGSNTDTQDKWGKVINTRTVNVTEKDILDVFDSFKGEIYQIPPMYSALKYKGKKLYELAREGKEIERKSRKIFIYELDIIQINENVILFDVLCSKGTYIRTLCEDIGNALNCGAYMSFLLRTKTGKFSLCDAVTLETLKEASVNEINLNYLFPIDYPITHIPRVNVKKESEVYLRNGNNLYYKNIASHDNLIDETLVRLYVENKFIALGKVKMKKEFYIDVDRVFY